MNEPVRPLRLVDPETGEITEQACPNCQRLTDQLDGAENNVRSMRAQMANLRRELAGEVDEKHAMFPDAIALFRYWQERCKHPRAEFTPDRMKAVLPFIKRHGSGECREAIRGAEFDPFVSTRKNGSKKRHDDWGLIFRGEDNFQSFRERAPDYVPTFSQLALVETADEITKRMLERAKLVVDSEDKVAKAHLLLEVNRLLHEWRESVHQVG